jgi:hypothetical protein
MALDKKELVTTSSADIFAVYPQVSMNDQITAIFGISTGAETLNYCAPVGFNATTEYYGAWMAPDPTVLEIDTGGAAGGTWGITYNGVELDNTTFAEDASASLVQATLASRGIAASVERNTGVYTITFDSDVDVSNLPTVSGDVTPLTGETGAAATATDGASTYGTHIIRGFVWPETVTLSAAAQVQGQVMVAGRIPYSYIAEDIDSGDIDALKAELKRTPLGRGIIVEDLVNIH